jgi:hypothetical protein
MMKETKIKIDAQAKKMLVVFYCNALHTAERLNLVMGDQFIDLNRTTNPVCFHLVRIINQNQK